MNDCLPSRAGEELSDAAYSMNLVIGRLTDGMDMRAEGEVVVKKDP